MAFLLQHPSQRFTNISVTGIVNGLGFMDVFKRKNFSRWQSKFDIPDTSLCQAVQEIENGLIDADLGNALFKKRIARSGAGKSSGYRALISARIGNRYVFLHGFQKSCLGNISSAEKKALQFAGQVFMELSQSELKSAISSGVLVEVCCEQNY